MDLSVIAPVYNEEGNLEPLVKSLHNTLSAMGKSYEIIFINDGSTDRSENILTELKKNYPAIVLISLKRNFGQTAALSAGFNQALGDIVVTMDSDGQNDPADIPRLIAQLEEGYDVVSGWRKKRNDPWIRKIPSFLANKLIAKITGVRLHDFGCTLKVYRKEIIKNLSLYGQMHRFIPAFASEIGASITEIPVAHHPRMRGKSNYGLSRTGRVILDLFTVKFLLSYSRSPIQIFGGIGLYSVFFGFVFFIAAIVLKWTEHRTLTGNPLFYLFIFMEMIGVNFILIGLLAELNIRTYYESQNKKTYVIKKIL